MNVRLAAHTISESSSVALRYMRDNVQSPEFKNVEGIAKFCSIINSDFDILNSRERYNKNKSKKCIDSNNIIEIRKKVEDITEYIKGLRTSNGTTPMVNCARKTGFVGMIISLHNVLWVYDTFIAIEWLFINV